MSQCNLLNAVDFADNIYYVHGCLSLEIKLLLIFSSALSYNSYHIYYGLKTKLYDELCC